MFDYTSDIAAHEPMRALELVRAILRIEDDPALLSFLAAGLLENLIPEHEGPIVDAAARRDPRFRRLLGGVWLTRHSPRVVERLEAAMASDDDGERAR